MTQNLIERLKPCPTPFCAVPEPYIERVGSSLFKARCKYCQVETEAQFNEAAAVEQWNTRTNDQAILEGLRPLVAAIDKAEAGCPIRRGKTTDVCSKCGASSSQSCGPVACAEYDLVQAVRATLEGDKP